MRKKIISIVSYAVLPYSSGGQKSIAQFNEYLAAISDLTVIGTEGNDCSLAKNYTLLPWMRNGKTKFFDISLFFKLKKLIQQKGIDTVIIEHPYMGWLGWLLQLFCNVQMVVHTHNIEYLRFKSVGKKFWPILKVYEHWVLKKAAIVFCISEEDKHFMIEKIGIASKKCHVITFGVPHATIPSDKKMAGTTVRKQHGILENEVIILFNGLLNYYPNTNAVTAIIEKINPILKEQKLPYKIIICGKNLPNHFNELKAYSNDNIIYTGFVSSIELYFKAADIFINPVITGGGIKTKLVEALSFNTTVISTKSGAIGFDTATVGNKLTVIEDEDWQAFAAAISQQIKLPIDTPSSFYDEYFWGNITAKALRILETNG